MLRKIREHLRDTVSLAHAERAMERAHEGMEYPMDDAGTVAVTKVHSLAYHIVHEYVALLRIWWCERRGHDMVDTSYGNAETGCMAGYCRRCGWSFHHTLY